MKNIIGDQLLEEFKTRQDNNEYFVLSSSSTKTPTEWKKMSESEQEQVTEYYNSMFEFIVNYKDIPEHLFELKKLITENDVSSFEKFKESFNKGIKNIVSFYRTINADFRDYTIDKNGVVDLFHFNLIEKAVYEKKYDFVQFLMNSKEIPKDGYHDRDVDSKILESNSINIAIKNNDLKMIKLLIGKENFIKTENRNSSLVDSLTEIFKKIPNNSTPLDIVQNEIEIFNTLLNYFILETTCTHFLRSITHNQLLQEKMIDLFIAKALQKNNDNYRSDEFNMIAEVVYLNSLFLLNYIFKKYNDYYIYCMNLSCYQKQYTPLYLAVLNRNFDIFSFLCNHHPEKIYLKQTKDGDTPFLLAVENSLFGIVNYVLRNISKYDIKIPLETTPNSPIRIAINNSNLDMVKILLPFTNRIGIDPLIASAEKLGSLKNNIKNKSDAEDLSNFKNSEEIVKLILQNSRDFDEENNNIEDAYKSFHKLQNYPDILKLFFNKCSSLFLQIIYINFGDEIKNEKARVKETNAHKLEYKRTHPDAYVTGPFIYDVKDDRKKQMNEILKLIWNHPNFKPGDKLLTLKRKIKGGFMKTKTRRILKSAKRRLKRTIRKRKYQITRRQLIK